jgi:hypothetical protein
MFTGSPKGHFLCERCGHKSNADYNASLNVRDRRVPFTDASAVTTRLKSALGGRAKKAATLLAGGIVTSPNVARLDLAGMEAQAANQLAE